MEASNDEVKTKVKVFRNLILGNWTVLIGLVFLVFLSKALVLHSGISFDFENVFRLNWNSFLAVLILLILTTFHFFLSYRTSKKLKHHSLSSVHKVIVGGVAGLLIIPFVFLMGLNSILIPLLVAGFIYLTLMDLFQDVSKPNLTWLLSWMIILSVFVTIVLFKYNSDQNYRERLAFVEHLLLKTDSVEIKHIKNQGDALNINPILDKIDGYYNTDGIYKKDIYKQFTDALDPSIRTKYDVNLFVFDAFKNSLIRDQYELYENIENDVNYTDSISINLNYNAISGEYIFKEKTSGTLKNYKTYFLKFTPKKAKSIERILSKSYTRDSKTPSYAVYRNNRLSNSNYKAAEIINAGPEGLQIGESVHTINTGTSSIWYRFNSSTYVLAQKSIARLIKPISLFSYTFTLFGLIILLLIGLNSRFHFIPYEINLRFSKRASLRHKLQLSLISLFIISFLIIGFVTLFYFRNLNMQYEKELISEKTSAVTNDLESILNNQKTIFNTKFNLFSAVPKLSKKHARDILIYDESGRLESSSFELSEEATSLSLATIEKLKDPKSTVIIENNKVGKVQFKTSYIPISLESQPIGFVAIQHSNAVQSQYSVHDFIGTLLNVYVFLFLMAGALAFAVSNSITRPISELGEKLKQLKLGKRNEVLEWKTQDELGVLIKNYNAMVLKLEESAQMIAKTERDHAWREMAKQVAHEIKNPLTPMKLSIQYLQRAINSHPEEAEQLINRVSSTLIEQIDNLSAIASAFSNFGKMPIAENQKIVVNEIVEAIHDLFRKREDMDINLYVPIDEVYVFADKNQLIRILNNIVKNAIQAIPTENRGKIDIYLEKNNKNAIIRISDNGTGIPDEMKTKVFRPNFTTKNSGTGLGLAMAANMIESFNGKIYFETSVGSGTDFYIELPLMHVNDNYKNESRVLLE